MLDRHTTRAWLGLLTGRAGCVLLGTGFLVAAGRSLPDGELARFVLHVSSLAITALIATTGLMPVLVRRLANGDAVAELHGGVRRGFARSLIAGLVFVAVLAVFGDLGDPWLLGCAAVHLALPLHLAAAPHLLEGRTGPVARAELIGRALALLGAAVIAWNGIDRAGPFLLAWSAGPAAGNACLAAGLPRELRRGFATLALRAPVSREETVVGAGDLARAAYFHGIVWLAALAAPATHQTFGAPFRLIALAALLPATLATTIYGPLARGRVRAVGALPATVGIGVAAALVLAVTAGFWLGAFFPRLADPIRAAENLRILAAAVPALFGSGLCLPALLARHADRLVLRISAAGLVTMVAAFSLARAAGSPAGALAFVACEWAVFVLALSGLRATAGAAAVRTTR